MMDYAVPGVKCVPATPSRSPRLPLPADARYRILGAGEVLAKLDVLAQPVPSRGHSALRWLPEDDHSSIVDLDDVLLDDELEHPPVVLASPVITIKEASEMAEEPPARGRGRPKRVLIERPCQTAFTDIAEAARALPEKQRPPAKERAYKAATLVGKLSGSEFHVYSTLIEGFWWDRGYCWQPNGISKRLIADRLDYHGRTVRKVMARLISLGLVVSHVYPNARKAKLATDYTLPCLIAIDHLTVQEELGAEKSNTDEQLGANYSLVEQELGANKPLALGANYSLFEGELGVKKPLPSFVASGRTSEVDSIESPKVPVAELQPVASPEARPVEDVKSNSIPMQMPLLDEPAPAPASSRSGYSEEFEAFWRDYPVTKGTSKAKAWKAWRTLTAAERKQAHEALPIFWQQWDTRLKARPDAICKHPQGYLNGKLFETLLEDNQKPGGVRFWWQDPASVARIKPEVWEKFIEGNCKQVWNREMLGPPPGHEGCVVPANIVEQLRLREQFDERGFRRSADYWTKLVVEHAVTMWPFTVLGPLPSHPNCRVPREVVEKLKLRERFDDDGLMRDKFANVPLTAPPKAVPTRDQVIAFLMALPGLFGKEAQDAARLRYQREIDKLEASDENLTALLLWLEEKAERLQAKSGGPNLSRVGGDTRTKPMQQLGPGALAVEYAKALADMAEKQLAADVEAMGRTLDPIDQQAQTEFIGVLQRITKGERIDAVRIDGPHIEVDEEEPVADRFVLVPAYIKWHGRTHGVESARKLYRYLQCKIAMHSDCAPDEATINAIHIDLRMLSGNR